MVLSKVLHFCSNTRLQDNVITDVENCLTDKARPLFMLYIYRLHYIYRLQYIYRLPINFTLFA